ncbi:MAG: lipid-binding SYLF domain-containing protein [Chlorobium sp.]|jgi:lipid-binding SYLF domain-containing protein|nr:lipid-binding SYLF domain-containing protein [Chlorobium sp.]
MMKMMKIFTLALLFVGVFGSAAKAGWDPADQEHAKLSVDSFRSHNGLARFFENAYGYVVFPDVYKGGFMLFGGGHGKGYVFEQNNLIGRSSITQLNVGPQLGGQSFSEIIFFKGKGDLDAFKRGNFVLSAQVTAIIVTTGMATNTDYSNGVAVFVRPKAGVMAEATVGGQKFSYKSY